MSQPIDWNTADVKQKTIYPGMDGCFHCRLVFGLVKDNQCFNCGKPWDEIEREGKARRLLKDLKRKEDLR